MCQELDASPQRKDGFQVRQIIEKGRVALPCEGILDLFKIAKVVRQADFSFGQQFIQILDPGGNLPAPLAVSAIFMKWCPLEGYGSFGRHNKVCLNPMASQSDKKESTVHKRSPP